MARERRSLINQLASKLPEGLIVDAAWLKAQGYSSQLQHQYVASGWLEQPVRSVFRRPRGDLSWQQVVVSLQTLLGYPLLIVGGRSALELQGYAHYLPQSLTTVHLYGPKAPPGWVTKLPLSIGLVIHNSQRLFRDDPERTDSASHALNDKTGEASASTPGTSSNVTHIAWGQWDWPLTLSTPERAILEWLDELPNRETFEQVDALFGGLDNLRPTRLQTLLADCGSIKVKRLFFFFADRHRHAWLKRLDKAAIDLGSGKRMLTKGGVFDSAYQITVPGDLDGVR